MTDVSPFRSTVIEVVRQGPAGPAIGDWRGTWVASTYRRRSLVEKDGSTWLARRDTSGVPGVSADWDLVVSPPDATEAAVDARDAALVALAATEGARDDAQTAQAGAETAQGIAEDARDAALEARDDAFQAIVHPGVYYDTLSELEADLAHPDGTMGVVDDDGVASGIYRKSGASGSGSWVKKSDDTIQGSAARVAAIRSDLASTSDPEKGAGASGFSPTVGYGENTLGAAIKTPGSAPRSPFSVFSDLVNVRDETGINISATTISDNNAPFAAARLRAGANRPIMLPPGDYKQVGTANFYGPYDRYLDALGPKLVLGTVADPATRPEPVLWIEKITSTSRAIEPGLWDQGAAYMSLEKVSGSAYAASVTAYARYSGGSGDMAALHARTRLDTSGAQGFAAWFYTHITTTAPNRAVGAEFNVNNSGAEVTWIADAAAGAISALNISMADGIYGGHHGIRFPNIAADKNNRFWTGIQFGQNCIKPTDGNGNGEAIRIRGASYIGGRYGGLAIGDATGVHNLSWGIRMKDAAFGNNCAVWLDKDHRLAWGASAGAGTYVTITSGDLFDVRGATIGINGTKVVAAHITGWEQPTGTKKRTTFATSTITLPELAGVVYAMLEDLGVGSVTGKHGLLGI